jgi:prepilin-type N-terminal cleavage/methylation domain-containing protein
MKQKIQQLGFTLLELLIVIGIIGILSAVIFVANTRSKMNARDAHRLVDVKEMFSTLHLYYSDAEDYPPDCSVSGYVGGCDQLHPYLGIGVDTSLDDQFVQFLTPDYIGLSPQDPFNTTEYHYVYATDVEYPVGSGDYYAFLVGAYLENEGSNNGGITPPTGQENFYAVGEKW